MKLMGMMRSLLTQRAIIGLLASGLLGCGGGPDTAQVSGKVLFKDGTAPKGGVCAIQFLPATDTTAEIRKAASGDIREDGTFEVYTRKPGDGIFIGKYDVTFAVWESPMSSVSLIDAKYTKPSTTPFHVTIDDDADDLSFEIEPAPPAKPRR